jgi:antitoxin component YwqK of YwqJK toxin-antitoxin module
MGEGGQDFGREGGLISPLARKHHLWRNIMRNIVLRSYLLQTAALISLSLAATHAYAVLQCELNSKSVNPSNGADLIGLTGLLRCTDQDTGKLRREQEMRGGKFIGVDRFFDAQGRLQRERMVNEKGNGDGRMREFWPSGQVRREANEINGSTQGAARTFYENGQLERVSFTAEQRVQASLAFTKDGGLTDISCHTSSVLPEDRKPCGFEGKVRTITVNAGRNGTQPSAASVYEQGKLLAMTTFREDGQVWAELQMQNGARWHRVFDSRGAKDGKNVLREERLYEVSDEPRPRVSDNKGPLQWSKLWGSNEQLTEHARYIQGRAVLTERWFLNGSLKEKVTTTGEGPQARTQIESYRDIGGLISRETILGNSSTFAQRVGQQQSYHDNGKLANEDTFSLPDERGRTRLIARKQWNDAGTLIADDEILEDGSRKKR